MIFRRLSAWFQIDDYSAAKEKATDEIIARYSRGNTLVQNGYYLDQRNLDSLSERGDHAMAQLDKIVHRRAA